MERKRKKRKIVSLVNDNNHHNIFEEEIKIRLSQR